MECGIESSEAHNCGNLRLRNVRLALGRQADRQTYIGKASQSARRPGGHSASYSAIQTVGQCFGRSPPFTGLLTFCRRYNANAAKRPKQPPKQTLGSVRFSPLCRRRRRRRRRRLGCRSSYSHLTNRNNKNKKTKTTTTTATETFGFGRGHNC